jgi:penicillin amidase
MGALLVMAALLWIQRWGESERQDRASFALMSGTILIPDLAESIEILRDVRGIPHVLARDETQGWLGLGFAHAQDRLAQMLWLRRRAQGRTAEVAGESALPADRLARLLEIRSAAEAAAVELPEASTRVLEAYSAGVNARISRVRRGLSAAPQALRERPSELEPWRPADSLAVVKLLSWCMGGTLETTLVLDDLIQRLDSVRARPFFPGGASIDFGVSPDFGVEVGPEGEDHESHGRARTGATRALCQGIGFPTGSAWLIEGRLSESGAPLLVADWHLEPIVPALFYEARVAAGEIEVAGATMPGSPIFWVGRNRGFAWAGVPASAPVSDLFIETLRDDRGQYRNGKAWAPVEETVELLRWKDSRGVLREGTMRIQKTRHGPLIEALDGDLTRVRVESATPSPEVGGRLPAADREPDPPAEPSARKTRAGLALAWTGARPGDGLTSMLALIRATDRASLEAALEEHHEPVLALTFANRGGQGGMQIAGWLPRRPLPTGLVPVQGRLRSFDWRERVPLEDLPHARLGAGRGGWVIAADQPWPSSGGLDQMEWLWRPGDRAARLEIELTRLTRSSKIDLRAAAALLQDDRAQRAPAVVAAVLGLAGRAGPLPIEAREIADLLTRWDGSMSAQSAGAAAYHLVLENLLSSLLDGPFGDALFERYVQAPHTRPLYAIERLVLRAAKLRRSGGWTDEGRVSLAALESLRGAWVALNHRLGPTRERWQWGGLHRLRFEPLGPEHSLPGSLGRSFPSPGSGQTLALTGYRAGVSFDVEQASVYRTAMDLESSNRLLSVLAPGQSEHPGHRHFADGLGRLLNSRLSLFPTSRLVIEEESTERLILEPAP